MHSNSLLTETVSGSPRSATDNLKIQSAAANLKGTKSMPNLSSAKSHKEIFESGSKRTGRSTLHFGKPEIAFGTRISPGNDTERLPTPDIKQGIISNSRFGHNIQKSVGKLTDDPENDTDSRESSAFTRYTDDYSAKDREDIYLDE